MEIESESTDDPDIIRLITNLTLSVEGIEIYPTPEEGEVGSPVAQAIFEVPGIAALQIESRDLLITRMDHIEWHDLIEDITAALRDFFL